MGMFDRLNNEKVKMFYTPFYNKDKKGTDFHYNFSGGSQNNFKNRQVLLLKSFWYKYPDDFLIIQFDYNFRTNVCPFCKKKIDSYFDKSLEKEVYICENCKKEVKFNEVKHFPCFLNIVKNKKLSKTIYDLSVLKKRNINLKNGIYNDLGEK